ncbi:hypothetical protein OSTOST_01944 [Ostertagia ostertagi]
MRSPLFHARSNGQAERFVDSEEIPAKLKTPCTSTPGQLSPAELFLGRQIRATLTSLKETTKYQKMESQFNREHGAREIVRDWRASLNLQLPFWTQAIYLGTRNSRFRRVLYNVLKEKGQVWKKKTDKSSKQLECGESCKLDRKKIPLTDEHEHFMDIARAKIDCKDRKKLSFTLSFFRTLQSDFPRQGNAKRISHESNDYVENRLEKR